MYKFKIAAIIVAYNPIPEKLNNLILSLSPCVDLVVVCNNSVYDIENNSLHSNLEILNFRDNLGLGKAQNIGINLAINKYNVDLVVNFDQDSIFEKELVDVIANDLMRLRSEGHNIAMLGPSTYSLHTNSADKPMVNYGNQIDNTSYFSVNNIISSGSIIWAPAFTRVSGYSEDLFIDFVDYDLCWRLKHEGYLVGISRSVFMKHELGMGVRMIAGIPVYLHKPFRNYFQARNYVILLFKKYVPKSWKIIRGLKLALRCVLYFFIMDKPLSRLYYTLKGFCVGFYTILKK